MQRKKIEVTVTDARSDDRKAFAPRDALWFLDWFRKEIDKIPAGFVGTTTVDLDVCESYEGHAVNAKIRRDERRKIMELMTGSKDREKIERQVLAELKKKYES